VPLEVQVQKIEHSCIWRALQSGEGEEDGIDYSQVDVMYDELLDRLDALDQSASAASASTAGGKHGSKVGAGRPWQELCLFSSAHVGACKACGLSRVEQRTGGAYVFLTTIKEHPSGFGAVWQLRLTKLKCELFLTGAHKHTEIHAHT